MRKPVFAANWKMHYGPQDTRAFLLKFLDAYQPRDDRTIIFFPPAVSLAVAGFALRDRPDVLLGVQNVHWEEKGAFTGETSALMARDCGATVALVGHSERRQLFGETDEMTARKCAAVARAGLTPLLCVGERLDEHERGITQSIVMRQLKTGVSRLEKSQLAAMLVAYEPVWAIGTGKTAKPEDATLVHAAIRRYFREALGGQPDSVRILYGGSVNTDNAAELVSAPEIDGLLVGSASLEVDSWTRIAST
ncbi:MAG TPA: triose-phosphate isomerase [Gemmatimonadaceae bacterium]|nr:triose-phosphate isomerase [Gemmatimonadaceae bacterium]